MKKYIGLFIILICLSSTLFYEALAKEKQGDGKGKKSQTNYLPKIADNPVSSVLDINNITSWITADGFWPEILGGDGWNGWFPKGQPAGVIFGAGIVWGGLVNDGQNPQLRVGGNTYFAGTTRLTRLFRVRPDWATADLTDDAANFFDIANSDVTASQIAQLKAQYALDVQMWPANLGAPYEDVNNDGVYEPNVDIPGIPGASQTIWISYNDASSISAYGSAPIGLKGTMTMWAYAIANPLGNVNFFKTDLIYQGTANSAPGSQIDSMYLVQWSDPDVGNAGDDFAGCDTTLGLGYAYNSTAHDAYYDAIGSPPPAAGYDFLQGVSQYTGNPADSAVFNLKYRHGYKYTNLNSQNNPMTTFVYFAAGGAWQDPSGQVYIGSQEWYSLMRGYQPQPWPEKLEFPTNVSGVSVGGDGTYLLPGDPLTQTGWVDGQVEGAGDRRLCLETGPFTMHLGDTVEVVTALIAGIGSNNLTSVSVLKFYDIFAQYAYDNLFVLPVYPSPTVKVTNFNGKVLLNWANKNNIDKIEVPPHGGYAFQGYNVYQLAGPSADLSTAKKLATFDVVDDITTILDDQVDPNTGSVLQVPVQIGKNTGISRFMTITQDAVRGNVPLANGSKYYFAVTAYGYNPSNTVPYHALESSPVVLTAIPQSPGPGVRYGGVQGDTLKVTHTTSGKESDGEVVPIVVDPTQTTGDNYKVTFDATGNWTLTDVTAGKDVFADQTNQSGDGNYLVENGLQVKVIGPPVAINTYTFTPAADRWFTGVNFGGAQFFGGLDLGSNFFGSDVTPDQYVTVEIRFKTNVADGQRAYRYLRGGTPSYGYVDYNLQHFTVWDVTSSPERQLAVGYVEQAGSAAANGLWEPTADSNDREYLFIFATTYTETPDAFYTSHNASSDADQFPTLYAMWPLQRGTMPYNPQDGQVFTIIPNFANTSADEFTFTAPAVTQSSALAKTDVNKINVFPNPYYGFNSRETTRSGKFVTFSHLPAQATIRIFDIAGHQVRVINKNDATQFINWDLLNDHNYPIASGVYVVYIDMPGLGTTKIIKLAVVQEQQILTTY